MSDELRIGEGAAVVLTVLSASAVRQALTACARDFHAATGTGFLFRFDTSGGIVKRVMAKEQQHLVASSLESLELLVAQGRLDAVPQAVGVSRVALGVRRGEAAPDISTVEKFRQVMLAATAIARGDPAGGGTAGTHLNGVFDRLDLSDATRARTLLRVGGYKVMQEVAERRADFGLTQSTEIAAVAGVEIGAFLPDDLQLTTIYAVAAGGDRTQTAALADFLVFIAGPRGRAIFAQAGFMPA